MTRKRLAAALLAPVFAAAGFAAAEALALPADGPLPDPDAIRERLGVAGYLAALGAGAVALPYSLAARRPHGVVLAGLGFGACFAGGAALALGTALF